MLTYTTKKPVESGLYLWKVTEKDMPFHVLASVIIKYNEVYVNLSLDVDQFDFCTMSGCADRLWCKVS